MEKPKLAIFLSVGLFLVLACVIFSPAQPSPSAVGQILSETQYRSAESASPPGESSPTQGGWIAATETALAAAGSNSIVYQNPRKYRVEYVATVVNNGYTITELEVYQPRPIAWDGQKDIVVEQVAPSAVREGTDPVYGNGIYYWGLANTPARGEKLPFTIRFTFTAYETISQIQPDTLQPYDRQSALYKLYTRPDRFIKSTDPAIAQLADQIAGKETNPYRLAKLFYEYIVANARYRLVGRGLLGAKALLANGEGECGEFASLFIALARAKGIPARPIVGYWAISGIEQTHVWAEFYLEGIGWVPVDPTMGQSDPVKYDVPEFYFGNMDNQRVILNKGFNIPMDPPAPDGFEAAFLQVPLWWFWGTDGDSNSVSMDRTMWEVTSIT